MPVVLRRRDESSASVHIRIFPTALSSPQDFDGVGVRLQMHEGGVALRLIEFVNVRALQVLDELATPSSSCSTACGLEIRFPSNN
jgi:hypothetical protein